MPRPRGPRQLRRRAFLGEVGKGTIAIAVFAPVVIAACSDDSTATPPDTATPGGTDPGTDAAPDNATTTTEAAPADPQLRWARTNHGFVSSYVLVRGTEVAIVDTGVAGSAADIGETITGLGLTYADVRHVILTHHHADHIGSITEVLTLADGAIVHAGEADLDEIALDSINPLLGGEDVFGLEMLATPGHTDGHIAAIDHEAGLLIAGDALQAADGGALGPNPNFSSDHDVALESVRQLAQLSFNTLLVGHGDPILDMADTAVVDLAASL